ncbi:hypothetical protein FA13DRAFT_1817229 [Coprinellus micaceus]|uniref:Uncharacterized protein n=1 Tax=Coprinellus micaceus TaxID=71717 RepID=A0A4Y7SV95_COPMI|nr:hypothetical protein FA13DRAFT_1817229 [Coprinellus micaceus]
MAQTYHRIKTSLFCFVLASLATLPIASALLQSDPESKILSLLNSTELADVAKKSGLPEATVQNCSICGTWAADVVQSKCGRYPDDFEFESDCFCAGDGPKKRQSCLQCAVDLGPEKMFGYSSLEALEAEWSEPLNDWCTELGFHSANITAYVSPTPGSPATQGNHGIARSVPRYLAATAALLATVAVVVAS